MTEQERAELCVTSYRKTVCDERETLEVLNEFAKEYDCEFVTKKHAQYKKDWQVCCQLDYSEFFTNYTGNELMIAYRLSKGGSIVGFTVENSYKQWLKDIETKNLQINND